MTSFQYRPIDHSRHEIRVLNILPSENPSADIECDLVHLSLDENPQYEALSYTWNANVFPEVILLDSHTFRITENLKLALRAFRKRTEVRALCKIFAA